MIAQRLTKQTYNSATSITFIAIFANAARSRSRALIPHITPLTLKFRSHSRSLFFFACSFGVFVDVLAL